MMRSLSRLARLVTRETTPRVICLTPDTRFTVDTRTRITGEHEDGRT
jgi:hypothetical protein